MAEMRIYEKYNVCKLLDFTYTWDSARNTFLMPASLTIRAGVTTGGDTTSLNFGSVSPTTTDTVVTAILPRNYRYNTVLDGVAFGNIKAQVQAMTGYDAAPVTVSAYCTITVRLKSITSGGVSTTHKTYTVVSNWTVLNAGAYPSTVTETKEFPFWIDLDNIFIPATEKILWEITFTCSISTNTGSAAGAGTAYHAINTDEMFIELPIVP